MKKFKFKFITSFWNEFSFLLRSCSCLLGLYLAGVSLMLCIFCASCSRPRLLFISSLLLCTACRVAVSCFMLLSSSKEMESQNVPDVLGVMGEKRRTNDWDYRRMRQESAETQLQLHELKGGNVVLERLLEEHKRSVEELTE